MHRNSPFLDPSAPYHFPCPDRAPLTHSPAYSAIRNAIEGRSCDGRTFFCRIWPSPLYYTSSVCDRFRINCPFGFAKITYKCTSLLTSSGGWLKGVYRVCQSVISVCDCFFLKFARCRRNLQGNSFQQTDNATTNLVTLIHISNSSHCSCLQFKCT